MKFETTYRHRGKAFTTVKAAAYENRIFMTACFDNESGQIAYPVSISIPEAVGMTFVLDSDMCSSCMFPPSVPEEIISGILIFLEMFRDIIDAARELINNEQERMKKENG